MAFRITRSFAKSHSLQSISLVPQRPHVVSMLREEVASPRVRRWFDGAALMTVLVLAAGLTGYNIFGYPHYELDEGTYVVRPGR